MRHTIRLLAAVAALVPLSVAVGASGASSSLPDLSSKLLQVSQMPLGWVTVIESGANNVGVGCLSTLLETEIVKPRGIAQTYLASGSGTPAIDEKLAVYVHAKVAFSEITAAHAKCKTINGKSGDKAVTGTMGRLHFQRVGNASAAFDVSLRTNGKYYHEDLVIVRQSNIVMGLAEAQTTQISESLFRKAVLMALSKITNSSSTASNT